jgi:hypothetical protein
MINLTNSPASNTQHPAYKMLNEVSVLDQVVGRNNHCGNFVNVGLCDHHAVVVNGFSFTTKTRDNGSAWASGFRTEVEVFVDGEYLTRY